MHLSKLCELRVKLTLAEQNYDTGNQELALEEWRHWLEGATHPFVIYTDHKNLEYLRSAKRLNPCQARWSLFFTRFHFMIAYRPGSKNTKADALSRMHALVTSTQEPTTILPSTASSMLSHDIDREIARVPPSYIPEECPSDRLFHAFLDGKGRRGSAVAENLAVISSWSAPTMVM